MAWKRFPYHWPFALCLPEQAEFPIMGRLNVHVAKLQWVICWVASSDYFVAITYRNSCVARSSAPWHWICRLNLSVYPMRNYRSLNSSVNSVLRNDGKCKSDFEFTKNTFNIARVHRSGFVKTIPGYPFRVFQFFWNMTMFWNFWFQLPSNFAHH